MNKIKEEINNFLKNYTNTSTKYFDIYVCITFSFLISGIIWIYLGQFPSHSGSTPNMFRETFGQVFIMLWFICLLQISPEKIEKAAQKFILAFSSLIFICTACVYWKKTADVSSFKWLDIGIILPSLIAFPYFLYIIKNGVKIIFLSIKELIKKFLPAYEQEKSRLLD